MRLFDDIPPIEHFCRTCEQSRQVKEKQQVDITGDNNTVRGYGERHSFTDELYIVTLACMHRTTMHIRRFPDGRIRIAFGKQASAKDG